MPKKILIVTTTTNREGPGNQLGVVLERLDRSRFEPVVLTVYGGGEWDKRYKELGVRRITFGLRPPFDLIAPLLLLRVLAKEKPDLVYTQLLRGDLYGRWAARVLGYAYATCVQNMDIWKRTGKPYDRFVTWLDARQLRGARGIVAVSHAVARDLTQQQGIPAAAITVIQNSLDVTRFSITQTAAQRAAWRKAVGIPNDAFVVANTSRLTYQKAPDIWLASAAQVVRRHPHVHFIQCGSGGSQMEASVLRMIARFDLGANVHVLGNRSDIPELLAASDAFVLPSRFEGLSTSLLEALAMGLPCIATNVSGNPEAIENNITGLLIPADDVQALTSALESLITDPTLRQRLGTAARTRTREHFSADRQARQFDTFLTKILT